VEPLAKEDVVEESLIVIVKTRYINQDQLGKPNRKGEGLYIELLEQIGSKITYQEHDHNNGPNEDEEYDTAVNITLLHVPSQRQVCSTTKAPE